MTANWSPLKIWGCSLVQARKGIATEAFETITGSDTLLEFLLCYVKCLQPVLEMRDDEEALMLPVVSWVTQSSIRVFMYLASLQSIFKVPDAQRLQLCLTWRHLASY
jgi:hypothetical protein